MGHLQNRTQEQKKMVELKRLPNDDFNRDVTAVAMDDRFYLVGQVDGTLAAVYISNGNNVFKSKISDNAITAVACEEKDDADNQIFYAGDDKGNLYTDKHPREEGKHPHHRQQGQVPDLRLHLQGEPELEPHHHRLQEGELHYQHRQLLRGRRRNLPQEEG